MCFDGALFSTDDRRCSHQGRPVGSPFSLLTRWIVLIDLLFDSVTRPPGDDVLSVVHDPLRSPCCCVFVAVAPVARRLWPSQVLVLMEATLASRTELGGCLLVLWRDWGKTAVGSALRVWEDSPEKPSGLGFLRGPVGCFKPFARVNCLNRPDSHGRVLLGPSAVTEGET